MPSLLCMCWVHNVCLCVKDCFSVPFTPWRSLVPRQCFPYMHITHRRTCANTHTDTHYIEQSVKCGDEKTMSLRHVTALSTACYYNHTGTGFTYKKKKGALDVVPSAKVNHDSVSLAASAPGLSYLKQAEEAHSQEKMAWGDGRACVPGIPQYTVDTLLWHLQGRLDRYSVIRVGKRLSSQWDCYEASAGRKVDRAGLTFYHFWMHIKVQPCKTAIKPLTNQYNDHGCSFKITMAGQSPARYFLAKNMTPLPT